MLRQGRRRQAVEGSGASWYGNRRAPPWREPYYRTTLLSQETDPNKLHDLKADLDACQVYDEQ
jgi:hypothetical protein